MDTEMGETGEGADEVKHTGPELGGGKLNGDMNGAYEDEPMDVSDSGDNEEQLQKNLFKKINSCNSSDDTDSKKGSECVVEADNEDVPNSEVPKNDKQEINERVSSNGYNHHGSVTANDDDDDDDVVCSSDDKNRVSDSVDCDDDDDDDVEDGGDDDDDNGEASENDCSEKGAGTTAGQTDVSNNGISQNNVNDEQDGDVSSSLDISIVPTKSGKQSRPEDSDVGNSNEVTNEENISGKRDKESCDVSSGKESSSDTAKVVSSEGDKNDKSEDKDSDILNDDDYDDDDDDDDDKDEPPVIEIDTTPKKSKKTQERKSMPINVTPRRSSRNLNKQKSYIEKDERDVPFEDDELPSSKVSVDDPDIEEIMPQDPLADIPSEKLSRSSSKKTTIVVNDTKRLAEIAAGSKSSKGGKKEPTLVIIDTNSILSGRGPVPLSSSQLLSSSSGTSIVAGPSRNHQNQGGYSVLPITLPTSQQMYSSPQSLRSPQTSIKPIPMNIPQAPPVVPPPQKQPVVLPSLTDDMYVVEAPSFIVPYVYEKPPIKPLKEYVEKLEVVVKELQLQLEKEEKERREKEEKEKLEKEKIEKEKAVERDEQSEANKEVSEGDKDTGDKEGEIKEKDDAEKMEVDESAPKEKKEDKDEESTKVKDESDDKSDSDDKPKDLTKEKEDKEKPKAEGGETSTQEGEKEEVTEKKKSGNTYFDNALGKFFMQIGINLVQEHVQTDLLRSQKRKREREGSKCAPDVHIAINSLMRTLEFSKENNEPFKMDLKKCEFCSFKTESQLVLAHHLETPHMRNYVYRCNFCTLEVRSPHDILFHMEAEHNVRGRLERAPAFHQCPSCPFEDNQKGKLTRHLLSCAKKYRPERNQEPPLDWEPPAKIPRVPRNRPSGMSPGSALYQAAMSGLKQGAAQGVPLPLLPKLMPSPNAALGQSILNRGRGRPQLANRYIPDFRSSNAAIAAQQKAAIAAAAQMRPGMVYRPSGSSSQPQVLLPTSYQISGNQLYQVVGNQGAQGQVPLAGGAPRLAFVPPSSSGPSPAPTPVALVPNIAANSNSITIQGSTASTVSSSNSSSSSSSSSSKQSGAAAAKLLQQPSISITPLPRQQPAPPPAASAASQLQGKPGRPLGTGKATFVICEICDGYIKDLELLRNHMQWIHKVKIHPKMIYNRPPLNCQKCQFRFFTDQGLERHLLGSHGLVTSSMQEAANKGKDGGRCPVCGRVYQWKLLNHVARDHNMSLKPAHLSYKCTVCTATFGMYKQFENHVYSAHSVVAKRVMDKKSPNSSSQQPSTSSSQGDSLLKPLKINDEITIIPQPPRNSKPKSGPNTRTSGGGSGGSSSNSKGKV